MTTQIEQDTYLAWAERAAKELKGKPLDTLNWVTAGGLRMKPYYSAEERTDCYPVIQTSTQSEWDVYESIEVQTAKRANKQAHQALAGGATALQFIWDNPEASEIPILLEGMELPYIQSGFIVPFNQLIPFAGSLVRWIEQQNVNPSSCKGFLSIQLKDTHSGKDLALLLDSWITAQKELLQLLPGFRSQVIDGSIFGHLGLPAQQELGLSLAWYNHILEQGNPPQEWQINLSFGSEFYTELCKFRIIAHLSHLIGEKYGVDTVPYLFASAKENAKSENDRYTNLLQLSTSAMSVVMGGANGILLKNFSQHKEDAPEFVARITRNCQLVLLHESKIGQVHDPASGSYFYEAMSFKLAEQAWESFLEIEEKGGLLAYLGSDTFVQKSGGTGK